MAYLRLLFDPELLWSSGPLLVDGAFYPLPSALPTTIGRGRNASLCVRDPSIADLHCRIETDGARFLLRDMDSTGGIHVNRHRRRQHLLRGGDVFQLNDQCRFEFLDALPSSHDGLARLRSWMAEIDLPFPPMPRNSEALLKQLEERAPACFGTEPPTVSTYFDDVYVGRWIQHPDREFLLIGHAGHGVSSHAFSYFLGKDPLGLFIHCALGGAYADASRQRSEIRACFDVADRLLQALEGATREGRFPSRERLLVYAGTLHPSCWMTFKPGEVPELPPDDHLSELGLGPRPANVLADAARWLESLR